MPRSMRVACVVLCIFYVLSFSNIFLLLVAPTSRASLWASVLFAPDATLHIVSAQKNHTTLPRLWIDAVIFFHRENPEIYYQFSLYEQGEGNWFDTQKYLYKANSLAPHHHEYRVALVQYLIKANKISDLSEDLTTRGAEGLPSTMVQSLYSIGLELITLGDVQGAVPFWHTSAKLVPSWSHVWLEYVALLTAIGDTNRASQALKQCESDKYAGAHCHRQREFLRLNPQQVLGRYRSIILGVPAIER